MKKLCLLLGLVLVLLMVPFQVSAAEGIEITHLHSNMVVDEDGSALISETITIISDGSRSSLEWALPIWYALNGQDYFVDYEIIGVDIKGEPVQHEARYQRDGLHVSVPLPAGETEYTINYRAWRQVEFFDEYDALHWALTGHWSVPVTRVTGSISVPSELYNFIHDQQISITANTGNTLRFDSNRPIEAGEKTWVSVSWPPGYVNPELKGERILLFHSHVTVNQDRTLDVTETITVYSTGTQIRRGIFRDFPTMYKDPESNRRTLVRFDISDVRRNGSPEPYRTEGLDNGTRVYIGDPDVFIEHGVHTYTFSYRTDRQLGFYDDYDALIWNVNGTGWDFATDQVTYTLSLPAQISRDNLEFVGFTGHGGSLGQKWLAFVEEDGDIFFATTAQMGRRQGLTAAVGWDKGHILPPDSREEFKYLLRDESSTVIALVLVLLLAISYLLVWVWRGRDPRRRTIIPRFTPPEGLSPAAVRYLSRMGSDKKTFTTTIINAAVHRYLSISQESARSYKLVRDQYGAKLMPEESSPLSTLFAKRQELKLTNDNHSIISGARTRMELKLAERFGHCFRTNRGWFFLIALLFSLLLPFSGILYPGPEVATILLAVGWLQIWLVVYLILIKLSLNRWQARRFWQAGLYSLLVAALAWPTWFFHTLLARESTWLMSGAICLSCILHLLFWHLLPAYSKQGREYMDEIEGFRLYLKVAEEDRLNLLNPPEKTPELFEHYLPYALALDVEQHWARQFNDVLNRIRDNTGENYVPIWYTSTRGGGFSASKLTTTVSGAFSRTVASAAVAPSSSGSGGSFSSGGGGGFSSGGGGGGGGGGGW